MSFRKRSVRPNLNLSKRSVPSTCEQKVAIVAKQIPDDEKPVQEKSISLGQEAIVVASASKQDVEFQLDHKEEGTNKREESCNSPTLGKRLSKRTKVAPKLTQQKKACKLDVNEVTSSPLCSQTSLIYSQISSPQCLVKPINNEPSTLVENNTEGKTNITDTNNQPVDHLVIDKKTSLEKSGEIDISMDVTTVYNLLASNENMTLINKGENKNESVINYPVESEDKDASRFSNDSPKTEIIKENRLHKRTRVMPKLTSRSFNKENKDDAPSEVGKEVGKEVGSVSEKLPVKDPSLLPENKQTDINKQDNLFNISKESHTKPFSGDPTIGITDDIDKCVKINSNITKTTSQNDICSNDNKEDVTPTKTSRLQKRVKVRPKLKARISSTTGPHDKEELESNDISKNESIHINKSKGTSVSENISVVGIGMIDVESTLTSSPQTVTKEIDSIMTNECDRTKDFTMLELQRDHCSVASVDNEDKAEYINSVYGRTVGDVDKKNEQSLGNSKYLISNTFDSSTKSELVSDKKELKHVRFTSDDDNKNVDYNDNYNDNDYQNDTYLTEITSKQCSPNNSEPEDDIALKLPISTENTNGKYDSNDEYDSLSEGELLGKQLVSKNKVFKPNLGAKRRERLSSFSAYSSCDEEDWQNQKRRKKEKTKNKPDESNEKDNKKQEEKKKKLEKPTKPKKNRENLSPNAEKAPKKRKKKAKPDVDIPPKHQKERDLSSLTMQELIHYNHPSFKTVELRSKRDEDENEHVTEIGSVAPTAPIEKKAKVDRTPEEEDEVMAPQIMINEDGEIVINQESLTISQKVDDSSLHSSAVVYEDSLSYGTHLKRKHVVGKRWKIEETLRFYKALSEIGTDFTLMSQAFGRFSRNELKKKFKKEEKVNCDLVDRALSNRLPLNMEMFLQGKEEMKDSVDENKNGDVVTRETVTAEAVTPEAVTPEAVTPEAVTHEAVTPEAVTPEAVTPEAVTPEAVTPEAVTPVAVTPVAVTTEAVTTEAVTTEAVTTETVTTETVTPVAVTPDGDIGIVECGEEA